MLRKQGLFNLEKTLMGPVKTFWCFRRGSQADRASSLWDEEQQRKVEMRFKIYVISSNEGSQMLEQVVQRSCAMSGLTSFQSQSS